MKTAFEEKLFQFGLIPKVSNTVVLSRPSAPQPDVEHGMPSKDSSVQRYRYRSVLSGALSSRLQGFASCVKPLLAFPNLSKQSLKPKRSMLTTFEKAL